MDKPEFRYYLITDRHACAPGQLTNIVEKACQAGIKAVQLREKDLADCTLYELGIQLRDVTARYDAKLFVNGRPDVATAVKADGVQCREHGLGPAEVKEHWPDLMVGASVHSLGAARRAEQSGADFLLFGPVFFTASKAKYGAPQGIPKLTKLDKEVTIPVFAVGGITPARVPKCLEAGAFGVAGISALMKADDVPGKVKQIEVELEDSD